MSSAPQGAPVFGRDEEPQNAPEPPTGGAAGPGGHPAPTGAVGWDVGTAQLSHPGTHILPLPWELLQVKLNPKQPVTDWSCPFSSTHTIVYWGQP